MNQEQKQEALERFQESQRIIDKGISRVKELEQLCQKEADTRKNDREHKKETLMPYNSDEREALSLLTQAEMLDTLNKQYDKSNPWQDIERKQSGLMHEIFRTLITELQEQGNLYHLRGMQMESRARHLEIKIRNQEGQLSDIQEKAEALSNSQDES